tara:strand:- start:1240 stop:1575 length:336 start_codon:yes stop_codon:yes gene_type:complete
MSLKELVNITDNAAAKAKELIKNQEGILGIRIKVLEGGCSGKTYNVDYAKDIKENEEVIKKNGVSFIIDPAATLFLAGCTIDWKQEKFKNGFTFENPNEIARCGCGESFSV